MHDALRQYTKLQTETTVEGADGHRLIAMLLDGAIERIGRARAFMLRGDIARKGEQIGWAVSVIEGLRTALDHERGGEIAANLEALYDYMERRLTEANLRNDPAILDEVTGLLAQIKSAWAAIPEVLARESAAPSGAVAGVGR